MKTSGLRVCALFAGSVVGISMVAILPGCGTSQNLAALPTSESAARISPLAKNPNLVYVADYTAKTVSVYSWPGRLLGTLTSFTLPYGLCSDEDGKVYVVDNGASKIIKYAHGGFLPIKTLDDSGQDPLSCSVDPKTGNLAVTNIETASGGAGSISIYAKAKGLPKIYSDIDLHNGYFCGYDDKGNLFADGYNPSDGFVFVELPAGHSSLINIKINETIHDPGGVQWDGKYVAVEDELESTINRLVISGSKARVQGSTHLNADFYDFWVQGSVIIAGAIESVSPPTGDVEFWNYPTGGNPTKTFSALQSPAGVTVSVPPPT